MIYYNFNTIYTRLAHAQSQCFDTNQLNKLFDLIEYNMQILEEFDELTTIQKEQINNFSIYALKVSKNYNKLLAYSLI